MADTATEPRADTTTPDTDLEELVEPDDTVTIVQALNRVMRDVRVLRKTREQKGSGGNFKFRGIDDAMNALGPMFRRHGVICVPTLVSVDVEHGTTKAGGGMTVTRVQVDYTFYGPKGDTIVARTPGESFDSGDKSTAKAMSVAYRTCLLQTFTLPTDEPDPDETVEELAPRQQSDPYRKELTPAERAVLKSLMGVTDADRLRSAWMDAANAQAEMPELRVRPGVDLTAEEAFVLEVEQPTPLKVVVGRIGTHLKEVGSSVKEAIEDGAAEMGGGYDG